MVILRRLALVVLALLGLTALTPIASSVTGTSNVLISPAYADDDDDDEDDGVRRRDRASAWQRPAGRNARHSRSYRDDDDRAGRNWRRSRDDDDDDDRDDD